MTRKNKNINYDMVLNSDEKQNKNINYRFTYRRQNNKQKYIIVLK